METIERTVKLNYCTSCEICYKVCPVGAITMIFSKGRFQPRVDHKKCTNCGLCLRLCPGIDPSHTLSGNTSKLKPLACYSGASTDTAIRTNAVSGGIATTVASYYLGTGKYDYAFVVKSGIFTGKSVKSEPVSTQQEVFSSARSKYLPVAVSTVIEQIKKAPDKNYIVIGTPCQLFGIKKFIRQHNINEDNFLFIGLFCDRTLNYNFQRYLKERFGRKGEKLAGIEYRTKEKNGWPGDIKLTFDNDRVVFAAKEERMRVKSYFQLPRCLYCQDKLNKNSDISIGDCYIPGKQNLQGQSSIVVRTKKAPRQ